jgi:hypothetical protein
MRLIQAKLKEPTSGLEPLTPAHYELDLDHSTKAEKSLTYSEKESQCIVMLCPITPRLVYRLV